MSCASLQYGRSRPPALPWSGEDRGRPSHPRTPPPAKRTLPRPQTSSSEVPHKRLVRLDMRCAASRTVRVPRRGVGAGATGWFVGARSHSFALPGHRSERRGPAEKRGDDRRRRMMTELTDVQTQASGVATAAANGDGTGELDPRRWIAPAVVLVAGFMDLLDVTASTSPSRASCATSKPATRRSSGSSRRMSSALPRC